MTDAPVRRDVRRAGNPLVVGLVVAGALVACAGAPATATPSAALAGPIGSSPPVRSPEPTRSADAGAPTPPSRPTGSFGFGEATLRTIADATSAGSHLSVGRELSTDRAYTRHAATYTSDGLTISALLLQPSAAGRHPGVVLVHGFVDPASYATGGELQREQDALARAGYVVLCPDLRGLGGSDPGPDGPPDLEMGATDDVVNAVAALVTADLPGLDRDRIALLGHSLGGLLVLNVLVAKPGLVDAAAAFAPSGTDRFADVLLYLSPDDPVYAALIAAHGTPTTNPRYWADVSPRTFVDRVTDPLLIVQGDDDLDVPPAGTRETVAIWRSAGKDVELVTLEGEGHVFETRWHEAMAAVTGFFAKHMR